MGLTIIPGEKLLIRMWDTLAGAGIGGLIGSWKTRREGFAATDVKVDELLRLAAAEDSIARSRAAATLRLSADPRPVELLARAGEPSIDWSRLQSEISSQSTLDAVRREINVSKALIFAERAIEHDASTDDVGDSVVDPDWLLRWRDNAGQVSHEELQELWGRLLAGEIKQPGTYSLRCLELIRNLSKDDAELINKLGPFEIFGSVYRQQKHLEEAGLTFSKLLELQDLGIVSGVDAIGVSRSYQSVIGGSFAALLRCHNLGLLVKKNEVNATAVFPAYVVTRVGLEVLALGKFEANRDYFAALGVELANKGFEVQLGAYMTDGTKDWLQNPSPITAPEDGLA